MPKKCCCPTGTHYSVGTTHHLTTFIRLARGTGLQCPPGGQVLWNCCVTIAVLKVDWVIYRCVLFSRWLGIVDWISVSAAAVAAVRFGPQWADRGWRVTWWGWGVWLGGVMQRACIRRSMTRRSCWAQSGWDWGWLTEGVWCARGRPNKSGRDGDVVCDGVQPFSMPTLGPCRHSHGRQQAAAWWLWWREIRDNACAWSLMGFGTLFPDLVHSLM